MKRIAFLAPLVALVIFAAGDLAAAAPSLTVRDGRGNPLPLDLAELEVDVRVVGDVAETTFTLGFRNDSDRLAEGEFVMPLPEGATVSRYALEVQGAMREAVAVEKERARFAYESIKAKMIDPGIVERQAGNVYRTRIFPIPRNGIKRVRVGYVEHLRRIKGELRYELPFQYDGPIAKFTGRVVHLGGKRVQLLGAEGLGFKEKGGGGAEWLAEATDVKVAERLGVRWAAAQEAEVISERDEEGAAWFYLTDTFPEGLAAQPRPVPASLLLIWDASASGLQRDHAREFALLDAYFRKVARSEVRLQILRNDAFVEGDYRIENGNWGALRKVLETVYYDGAAGFEQLDLSTHGQEVALLFTDALSPHSMLPPVSKPLFVIDAAPGMAGKSLRAAAERSGGAYLDLLGLDQEAVLRGLTERRPAVIKVAGALEGETHVRTSGVAGDPVRIVGRIANAGDAGELKVIYGVPGGAVTVPRTVSLRGAQLEESEGLVARLWSQQTLLALEEAARPVEAEIVAHCRRYGLVSAFTSLIVLERFVDHVRYEIPPPEPQLREHYERVLREKGTERERTWRDLAGYWRDRRDWHGRDFPWMEVTLVPRLQQVTIWVDAVKKVFRVEELDEEAFGVIESWRQSAQSLVDGKAALRDDAGFQRWFREVGKVMKVGNTLRDTPVKVADGKPVVVSVRGLVNAPGKIAGGKDLTLRKAIDLAGGMHVLGTMMGVEHYRNAGKTVYNLLSQEYEDVPLKPGDMIVVRDAFRAEEDWDADFFGEVDPFGNSGPGRDPAEGPAVVANDDLWIPQPDAEGGFDDADPFGDAGGGGAEEPRARLTANLRVVAMPGGGAPDLQEFAKALKAGGDPQAVYRKLRGDQPRPPGFFIEAARVLFAEGEVMLGRQALSNLLETPQLRIDRLIACAMWLEAFKQEEAAVNLLRSGRALAPDEELIVYHLARLAARSGRPAAAADYWSEVVKAAREDHPALAMVALTDLFATTAQHDLAHSPVRKLRREGMPDGVKGNLPTDLRVVISTNHPDVELAVWVDEPSGHTCRDESPCGGLLTTAESISEYLMRRALPGKYTVTCRSPVALTVHAVLYQDWGGANQTRRDVTIQLDGDDEKVTIAEIDFAFAE